ncbi:hypothetical protein GH714_038187 [Hevea brasiliensis]|uniref:Uncharacterized protein n=1 Tax=Hevea brasiliensis TaxID=3981 RepID=A0A6A6LGZ5_HEVBR|nr:hypothetical protein GH714_038187 [Hevea brasiliensis]
MRRPAASNATDLWLSKPCEAAGCATEEWQLDAAAGWFWQCQRRSCGRKQPWRWLVMAAEPVALGGFNFALEFPID